MRVALVSEHASPLATLGGADAGGQNVHVAALALEMGRRGAEVVVHTRRDDRELPELVRMAPRVVVHHVEAGPPEPVPKDELFPHMDAFADRLGECWRRRAPDVVHAHFWMSGYAALRAAAPLGIPVAQTFHALGVVKRRYQGDRDTSPAVRLEIERDIVSRVPQIIATCADEVFELMRIGAGSGRLTVIPCGVDLSLFGPDGPADPRGSELRRLVCVGRLVERKGMGNAISALEHVPGAELVIAGGPARERLHEEPEARRLLAIAREAGVADRVQLRGRLERGDVPPLLRSADALVSVPWYEPFGIAPLEAMACGVPVVASAVGGMIDTVVDGVTGMHVAPRDPERLAAALNALLAEPDLRAGFGRAGVERARRLYDWRRIAAATLDVYERMARQRPRRARRSHSGRFSLPPTPAEHLSALRESLQRLEGELERLSGWGERLAARLLDGGRLLAVGNGGSAAQAQHLTAELVGRYETEREPLSAICLHGDTSTLTAITNDYGAEEAFARQVRAHARPGDVLLCLSTSGCSANVVAAANAARACGAEAWAFTGPAPNPLAEACDDAVTLDCASTATVQELHQVAIHLLCAAVDREVALRAAASSPGAVLV
jgi:glycosyltransferase involved in cell wall biosynthesis/phosphoheptose isomerase